MKIYLFDIANFRSIVMNSPFIPRIGDSLACFPKVGTAYPIVNEVLLFPSKEFLEELELPDTDYIAIIFAE